MRGLIEGADALAHERLWDRIYRVAGARPQGRGDDGASAPSTAPCGTSRVVSPTCRSIACWAGRRATPCRPTPARSATRWSRSWSPGGREALVAEGYTATKWFYRHGPSDGRAGMVKNEELVATLREAVGPDVEIMIDAWMSWDVPVHAGDGAPHWSATGRAGSRSRCCRTRSTATPRSAARVPCRSPAASTSTPAGASSSSWTPARVDVVQADIYWAGGITEMLKICAIASAYDLPVIPHGHSTPASIHLIAAQPEPLTPMVEYLVKWNDDPPVLPEEPGRAGQRPGPGARDARHRHGPGRGKIEERVELRW